jgi:SagB-type dehydrogenase family enzyme
MESIDKNREFLKSTDWSNWGQVERDQAKGVAHPPLEQPYPQDAAMIELVTPENLTLGTMPLIQSINQRRSHRKFSEQQLTLEELSFLLWTTQGVHQIWKEGVATRRTVPAGGSLHAFETYLLVHRVGGLDPGLYRYLSLKHKLCFLRDMNESDLPDQWFLKNCAAVFIWTAVPYRKEWRYSHLGHKAIALDAGHVCQNLYLACESIGAGTCAIAAYHQDEMDSLVGVDGVDEFTIYVAPVGKKTEPS